LPFGPFADGRTTADFCVLLLDLGCSSAGNVGTDVVLEGTEGNQVLVSL
jgi:hypothetical protein